jgi:O-antigen ligase
MSPNRAAAPLTLSPLEAGSDNTMLWVTFGAMATALLFVVVWSFFETSMIVLLALPTLFGILPAFTISGLLLAWRLPFALSRWFMCVCLVFIDLGFGALTPVTLGLKLLAYIAALLLGLRALTTSGRHPLGGATWFFFVYALFAFAGVSYSIERFATAYTSFALIAVAFLAIWCTQLERSTMRSTLRQFAAFLGVFMILSGLFWIAVPSLVVAQNVSGEGRVSGLFGSPNTAGGVAALTVILNLWCLVDPEERARVHVWLRGLFAFAGLALLALSGSRTSMMAMGVALAALFALNLPRLTIGVLVALVSTAIVLTMFDLTDDVARFFVHLLSRTRSGADVSNLTGRLDIWHVVIREWKREPWIGYGLAGGRTLIAEGWVTVGGKTTGTAHNAILESLLAVGVIGTSLLLASALLAARELVSAFRFGGRGRKLTEILIVLMLFVFVFGLTEKSFAGTPSLSTGVLALVIGMSAALRRERHGTAAVGPMQPMAVPGR